MAEYFPADDEETSSGDVDYGAMKPPPNTLLQAAGDIVINEVLLISTDGRILQINDFIVEINIYEDMFSPCLHGNVVIRDTKNLIGNLPIIGDEMLSIDVSTPQLSQSAFDPENRIQKTFAVYAVNNRFLSDGDKEQMYILRFISLEGMYDNVSYICEKLEGTTDEVAEKIYKDSFSDIPRYINEHNTKETAPKTELIIGDAPHTSKISFLPPLWTPFQIMNYLAKRAIGTTVTAPTFLFYETTKRFYFCSFNDLVRTQMEAGSIFSDVTYLTKSYKDSLDENAVKRSYSYTEDVKFLTNMDVLQGQDLGHYASSLYVLDMVKKEFNLTVYDHGFSFQDYNHLEGYKKQSGSFVKDDTKKYNSIFPATAIRSADSKIFIESIHPGVLDNNDETLINLHPENFVQQRNSIFADISTMKMKIVLPGRTDAEVGTIINFTYPSVQSKDHTTKEEQVNDPWISGYYMITAIHHQITKLHHNMICEIAKDSFLNELVKLDEGAAPDATPASNNPPAANTPAPAPKTTK